MRRFVLRSERPNPEEGEILSFPNRYYLNGEHGVYLFQPDGLGDEKETKFADTFNGSFLKTVSNKVMYSDFTATLVITPGSGGWWIPGIPTRTDWSAYSAYDVYNELLAFLHDAEEYGLHLGYQSNGRNYRDEPYSGTSTFPDGDLDTNFYYSKVKFKSISKTELDVYGNLQCKIVFSRLAPWRRWNVYSQEVMGVGYDIQFDLVPGDPNVPCVGTYFKVDADLSPMSKLQHCALMVGDYDDKTYLELAITTTGTKYIESIEYSCDPLNCYVRVNGSSVISNVDISKVVFPKNLPTIFKEHEITVVLHIGKNSDGTDTELSGNPDDTNMIVQQYMYYGSV